MLGFKFFFLSASLLMLCGSLLAGDFPDTFLLRPIGEVKKAAGKTFIEVYEQYREGLQGLDEFSHVTVVYWLHKNDNPEGRGKLLTKWVSNGKPVGVFATHSPARPNLIAISECRLLSVEQGRVYVEEIDAFEGTPVLDLKCFVPYTYDRKDEVFRLPKWASDFIARRNSKEKTPEGQTER